MVTYEITFNDNSTETITCKSYTTDGVLIRFLDSDSETLLMTNFAAIKFIKLIQ